LLLWLPGLLEVKPQGFSMVRQAWCVVPRGTVWSGW
jgi:hypothetical protein